MDSHFLYFSNQLHKSSMTRQIGDLVRAIRRSSRPAKYVMQRYLEGRFDAGADHMKHLLILGRMYDFVAALDSAECAMELVAFREACISIGVDVFPGVGLVCLRKGECGYLSDEETLDLLANRIRTCSTHCVE
ncbi:hypothetical protein A9972_00615 [Pseudomonas sp. UME83]|nr:hypothetical protein [Pseudomonas sp. UMC76]MBB1636539.1 hypothetical protein [Pseudomonas sp. UME83]